MKKEAAIGYMTMAIKYAGYDKNEIKLIQIIEEFFIEKYTEEQAEKEYHKHYRPLP